MTQDLFDWLNSAHSNKGDSKGLLLAPVVRAEPENPQATTTSDEDKGAKITALNDAWQGASVFAAPEPEATASEYADYLALQGMPHTPNASPAASDYTDYLALQEVKRIHEASSVPEQEMPHTPEASPAASDYADLLALQEVQRIHEASSVPEQEMPHTPNASPSPEVPDSSDPDPQLPDEHHTSILNQAWHKAADLSINLNEPPQEMWANIDDDDEPKDYIETSSLQGDAYIPIPKHGANFTQRLQATLRGRKERAARLAAEEAQREPNHPYLQKAMIFSGILMMTLAFACLGLWFIQRETPENLNARAHTLYAQGKFDEAAELYHRGHRRYPHILTFLTGLARSSQKAGRTQTAIAAWNEYAASLPKDDTERLSSVQTELDKLIPGGVKPQEPQPQPPAKTQEIVKTEPMPAKPKLPEVRPLTFDEALEEANHAFNIGMYSRAIRNFHKAHAIREDDIRPYVGLARAYRAKGMFFDSKRMLDEARRKFGRNPTLEVERRYLRGE